VKPIYTAGLRGLEDAGTPLDDATTLDALGAGFDLASDAVDDAMDYLQIWPENARRYRRDVLTDSARFLGLTATQDMIAAYLTFATNFATSRHD